MQHVIYSAGAVTYLFSGHGVKSSSYHLHLAQFGARNPSRFYVQHGNCFLASQLHHPELVALDHFLCPASIYPSIRPPFPAFLILFACMDSCVYQCQRAWVCLLLHIQVGSPRVQAGLSGSSVDRLSCSKQEVQSQRIGAIYTCMQIILLRMHISPSQPPPLLLLLLPKHGPRPERLLVAPIRLRPRALPLPRRLRVFDPALDGVDALRARSFETDFFATFCR
ncbi:uncharacterized protein J3D65DRAFT_626074 [Phyllosticta citribraziliensis]|uniref:Uncharacterized protein n=1 Tax=Phyllosticta citribraziliensis TaxID=989973 RepID=A0ABR1LU37_9PEZI